MTSLRAIGVQQQNEISIHGISTRCIQRDLLYSQMLQFPASWRKLNKINEIMAVQTARRGG
jgi:hypothetical protein